MVTKPLNAKLIVRLAYGQDPNWCNINHLQNIKASETANTVNPALLPYLNRLQKQINGDLFSEKNSPEISNYVYLPEHDYNNIQTEEDFFNLLDGMAKDVNRWFYETHYQTIKLEKIRIAARTLNDKSVNRIWFDESLSTQDQEKLKTLIDKKLSKTKHLITTKESIINSGDVDILCSFMPHHRGVVSPYPQSCLWYSHQTKSKRPQFFKQKFWQRNRKWNKKQSEPYIKEINAAKAALLSDKNRKAHEGNVVKVPKDVIKKNLMPYFDNDDLKNLSIASRLFRNIIYNDATKRYLHTPAPIIKPVPAERCVLTWEDGTTSTESRELLTRQVTTYTLTKPDNTKTLIKTIDFRYKPAPPQVGKINETHFWMLYNENILIVVDRTSGVPQNVLSKEFKYTFLPYSIKHCITGTDDKSNLYISIRNKRLNTTGFYQYSFSTQTLKLLNELELSTLKIRTLDGITKVFTNMRTSTGNIKSLLWNGRYKLPISLNDDGDFYYLLKNGKFLSAGYKSLALYEAIDPNQRKWDIFGETIFPTKIKTLAKFDSNYRRKAALFKRSRDGDNILILYHVDSSDWHKKAKLFLSIFDVKSEEILNTIKVDWSYKDDGNPTKLYFDDKNNICIEGSQTKLITYPYGDQAIEYEVDRKACLRGV